MLLAEQHGLATLLIIRKSNGTIVECMSAGPGEDDQLASMSLINGDQPAPPAGTVTLETMSSSGDGDGQWSNIVGLVGAARLLDTPTRRRRQLPDKNVSTASTTRA